jgi:mono/diheme cytochrome c family protein
MIWLAFLLSQAPPDAALEKQGEAIFARTCAVAYCHGPAGGPGRAPKLAGRPLDRSNVRQAVVSGIRGTAMPGFLSTLGEDGINAVLAYVARISNPSAAAATPAQPAPARRPPEAEAGRALFFDAARLPSCGACHSLEGWGAAIGPDLTRSPVLDADSLAKLRQTRVRTAYLSGEDPFPALPHAMADGSVTVYDLSSPLPVLRTFLPSEVTITGESSWPHESATRKYSKLELESILKYLRWLSGR